MNALTSILSKMPGLKSSEDFAGAITTLEAEHAAAVAAVAELEGKREDAIFGSGDLDKLEGDIALVEGRVRTLATAIAGATKRREAAVEAERQAELEATGKAARKINARLESALKVFSENAEALAKSAELVTKLRKEIAVHNTELREGNRADLVTMDPIKREARETDRQITDPLAGLVIAGHWPTSRPFLLAKAG